MRTPTDEEIQNKWKIAQRIMAMYICPTTGKLIDTRIGDDKVCCTCTREGTHRVSGLRSATFEDFVRHARERAS